MCPRDRPRAVMVGGRRPRRRLRDGLTQRGVDVVAELAAEVGVERLADVTAADCLVVDMAMLSEDGYSGLGELLADWSGAVIFAETTRLDADTLDRLAAKVREQTGCVEPRHSERPPGFPVCVLAASFGGPPALRRFLLAFREPPPAAFLIAQHIGQGFSDVLARQLGRDGLVPVRRARAGAVLRPGRAWVYPVTERLALDAGDRFRRAGQWSGDVLYRPCIDDITADVARRYGPRAALIVFTGMGDDGAAGARMVTEAGGAVWAQTADSAAVAHMPDMAAAAVPGTCDRGDPEALAAAFSGWLARRGHARPSRTASE